jgi:hypothetical protein
MYKKNFSQNCWERAGETLESSGEQMFFPAGLSFSPLLKYNPHNLIPTNIILCRAEIV